MTEIMLVLRCEECGRVTYKRIPEKEKCTHCKGEEFFVTGYSVRKDSPYRRSGDGEPEDR